MTKQNNPSYVLFMIMLVIPLSGFGIDLYAPALPAMARFFQVTPAAVKMTMSAYVIGICLGQMLSGTLSDSLGRKPMQVFGAAVFTVSSCLIALSPRSIAFVILFRGLQGFSSGCMSSSARSQIPDLFAKDRMKHISSYVAIAWGIGPIIAPWIGGYLQNYFGWRSCFYFYAAYGAVLFLLMTVTLKETIREKTSLNLSKILKNYKLMLIHSQFVSSLMIMGIGFMMLMLFGMVGPFIIQVTYHLSVLTYGYLALIIGVAYFSGSIASRIFAHFSGHATLQNSFLAMIVLSLVFWALSLLLNQVWIYIVYVFLMNFLMGLIYPACMTVTMSLFQHMSGTASAVMGSAIMCIAGILSVIIGHIHLNSVPAVIVVYLVLAILSLLLYWSLLKNYFVTR